MGIRRRALFLKWCVINLIATTISTVAIVLDRNQLQSISVVTLVFAGSIGLVYAVTTIYAGVVSWNSDTAIEGGNEALALRVVRHAADHIKFAALICPYIGLIGSVTGMYVTLTFGLQGTTDSGHIKTAIPILVSGVGIALLSTVLGLYACLVLTFEHHFVKHAIDRPLAPKDWI